MGFSSRKGWKGCGENGPWREDSPGRVKVNMGRSFTDCGRVEGTWEEGPGCLGATAESRSHLVWPEGAWALTEVSKGACISRQAAVKQLYYRPRSALGTMIVTARRAFASRPTKA